MDIHRSSIRDYIMPKVKSVFVIDYYKGIRALLASRDEFPYPDFLANPRLRTQTEITWATDVFTGKPMLLSDLDGVLKERYAYALKERISSIESLIDVLAEEGGGEPLGELLSKAVSYIDERSVYCGDGHVVVVNWGLIPRTPDIGSGSIYRSGKFVASWDQLHTNPDIHKPHLQNGSETVHVSEPQPVVLPVSGSQEQKTEEVPAEPISEILIDSQEPEEQLQKQEPPSPQPPSAPSIQLPPEKETGQQIQPTDEEKPEQKKSEEDKPNEPHVKSTEKKSATSSPKDLDCTWKTFFVGFWKGLKFLLRKLWWILVLILLVLATLFLSKGCQGPISQVNPFYNPLPEKPVILPIENGDVGMSADGKTQIAIDRLNILLEKTNENTMLEWAKAFKKAYPDAEYNIFYYNKDLYNLQIAVPPSAREQVKKEIKDKLRGFSFDVFDELVYKSEAVSFNDPELKSPTHSWYLNAIGAYEAWDIVQGDSDVVVAIVDNGFDLTHPEFKGKIVHPYNVLTQDANLRPIITKEGENAHGTHVAATAVGNGNNGTGLLGIAPNCRLLPVQVANDNAEGSMSNQAIMDGVMYAISQGADVINVSLGMYTPDNVRGMSEGEQLNYISNTLKQDEYLWDKIFEKAKQRNCIIVFAAGNDNVISGIDPRKRSNETIRVSAVTTTLEKAHFSNYGRYPQLNREYSTVSAPGVEIFSAAPHGRYVSYPGTSMAAPIVSGTVALLKSIDRNITAAQAMTLLKETGREVNPSIGPLINLGKVIKRAANVDDTPRNCEDIAREIERLKARIDSLSRLCPGAEAPSDTLKYKDAVKDNRGLDGLWKTTTSLVASSDNTPIELYMQFKKLKGVLTIKNQGNVFTAPLTAKITNGKIFITQSKPATSKTSSTTFSIYQYECSADRKGNLTCKASHESATITFNLIRVK